MAKKGAIHTLVSLVVWITGVLVSLAVGFGMTSGTLTVPFLGAVVPTFGWIVVVLTIIGVVLAIIEKAS